jgi:hypothetical protein
MMDDIRLTLNASIVLSAHMHIVILLYLGVHSKIIDHEINGLNQG